VIPINVKDEFAPLKVAVVHDAGNAIDFGMEDFRKHVKADVLREHPESGPIFQHRLIEQQAQFPRPGKACSPWASRACFQLRRRFSLRLRERAASATE